MAGQYVLDANGDPQPEADLMKWALWFGQADIDRVVAAEVVGNVRVSTAFLGLDHNFGHGAPLLFETMVFGGPLDGESDRYSTKAEALAGHAAIVAKVKGAANSTANSAQSCGCDPGAQWICERHHAEGSQPVGGKP